jgi:hypothetical protein
MRHRVCVALLAVGVLCPGVCAADDSPGLDVGARVRVRLLGGDQVSGRLRAADERALVVEASGDVKQLPREQIAALAVSAGREPRRRKALVGAAIGGGVGVLLGLVDANHADSDSHRTMRSMSPAHEAAFVGASLAVVGGVVGFTIPPGERWRAVAPHGFRLGVRSTGGSFRSIALALEF